MTAETINTGLNGVPVCASGISSTTTDSEGYPLLMYRKHSIYDVIKTSFEEAAYLILNGELPDKGQLEKFTNTLKENRGLDKRVIEHIKTYPKNVNRMDFLLTTLSFCRMFDKDYENQIWCDSKADPKTIAGLINDAGIRIGAKIPTIIAYGHRILNGHEPIAPSNELSHAENFLRMLGLSSNKEQVKAFDTSLILYLDHTINNSTFLARVAESARPDPYGPYLAASVGLKGVLHGGANEMASRMLDEIDDPSSVEAYVSKKMGRGEVIFGFGHRLGSYKTHVESRVRIVEPILQALAKKAGQEKLAKIYDELVRVMDSPLIEERKRRAPNLDMPTSVLYRLLGIAPELNTPIFQASRHFGWAAHMIEQRLDKGPLYRPTQVGRK